MLLEVAIVGLCAVFAGGLWAIWARMGRMAERLDNRIDSLGARVDSLDERISGRINVLSERVARIEGMLTALLPSPEPSPN